MKKLFKWVWTNKIITIILILTIIAFPTAITKSAQGETTSIIVAMGIDKKDNRYLISLQATKTASSVSSDETLEIFYGEGLTVSQAFSNIEQQTGKKLGFEHCNLIVLADSVSGEDCRSTLDVLYRKANITLKTFIVNTDISAKYIMEKTTNVSDSSNRSVQTNLGFNKNIINSAKLSTLGDFFNDYYSKSKISYIAFLKSYDSASDEQETDANNFVENKGETAIFYNGKKITKVDEDLTSGFNWINKKNIQGNITVENVSDEKFYNNATVGFYIQEGTTNINLKVENKMLFFNVDINLDIEILEINQSDNEIDMSSGFKDYITDTFKEKTKEKINSQIENALLFAKEKKIDLFNVANQFYKFKFNDYKSLIENRSFDDIYNNFKITTDIKINSYR